MDAKDMATPRLDERFEASLEPGLRLRAYGVCVGLVLASVPFLHLYLDVDLTAAELAFHAADISLGTLAVLSVVEVATSLWQRSWRWHFEVSRRRLVALVAFAGVATFSLQALFHDWLPISRTIRLKHVDAGYGDMSLRVLPLIGLIGYLVLQTVREQLLKSELEALRALNRGLAERGSARARDPDAAPVVFRHEGRDLSLAPSTITRVQAEENYCRIHSTQPDGEWLVRTTLAEAVAKLPPDAFLRVHRSHVVGVDHVREVVGSGRRVDLLVGDARVPVSRSRLAEVRSRLQTLTGGLR